MKHLFSKSSYIRSLQCIKSLYLYKNFYHLRDPLPPGRKLRFEQGHNIGKMAWQLFPAGVDASPTHISRFNESISLTKELIALRTKIIYEPAVVFSDVLIALDILVWDGDGWKAYEVKSSTTVSQTYLNDAALQYYVLAGSGLMIKDFSIVYLKKHHKEIVEGDPVDEIFQFVSVLEECKEQSESIKLHIDYLRYVLADKKIPQINMGSQCNTPYTCDFVGLCTSHNAVPTNGLFQST